MESISAEPDLDGRSWLSQHLQGALGALVGSIVGLVAGFWAGGYLACSAGPSCEFRADLAGALGTWVGGLGTIGAVVFAVVAFRSEEASRRREERARFDADNARREEARAAQKEAQQAEEEQAARDLQLARRHERDANMVEISWEFAGGVGSPPNMQITGLRLYVSNGATDAPLHRLECFSDDYGQVPMEHTVQAGKDHRQDFRFGVMGSDGDPIPMPDHLQSWLLERVSTVTIWFTMHDKRWKRRGNEPVKQIPDEL